MTGKVIVFKGGDRDGQVMEIPYDPLYGCERFVECPTFDNVTGVLGRKTWRATGRFVMDEKGNLAEIYQEAP